MPRFILFISNSSLDGLHKLTLLSVQTSESNIRLSLRLITITYFITLKAVNISTQWAEASPTGCDRQGTGTRNLPATEEHHGIQSVAVKENTHVTGADPMMSHVTGTDGQEESCPQAAGRGTGRIAGEVVGIRMSYLVTTAVGKTDIESGTGDKNKAIDDCFLFVSSA